MVALHTVTGQAELPVGKWVLGKAIFREVFTLGLTLLRGIHTGSHSLHHLLLTLGGPREGRWQDSGCLGDQGAGTEGQGKEEPRIAFSKPGPAGWL